jgi:hypothetical protein
MDLVEVVALAKVAALVEVVDLAEVGLLSHLLQVR